MTLIAKLIGSLVGSKSQSSSLAELASQSKAELLSFQAEPTKWHSSEDQTDSALNDVNHIYSKRKTTKSTTTNNGKNDRKSSYQRKAASKLRLYLSSGGNNVNKQQSLHQAASSTQSLTITQPNHYSNPKSLQQQQRTMPINIDAQQQQQHQLPVDRGQAAPKEEVQEQEISFQTKFENAVPKPIQMLLNDLYLRGPQTEGIFRKSPNAKHCRELRQLLESAIKECQSMMNNDIKLNKQANKQQQQRTAYLHQPIMSTKSFTANNNATTTTSRTANEYGLRQMLSAPSIQLNTRQQQLQQTISELQNSIEQYHVNVVASVFKEWLRSQNDCVLMSCLYAQWIDAAKLIEPISGLPTRTLPEPEALALQLYEQQRRQQRAASSAHNDSRSDRWPKTKDYNQDHYASSSGNSSHNEEDNISGDVPVLRSSGATTTTNNNLEANASDSKQPSNNNNNANDDDRNSNSSNSTNSNGAIAAQSDNSHATDLNLADKQRLWWLAERRQECLRVVRQLLATINEQNLLLLQAIISVLCRISAQSDCNKMSNQNLGVCVGQSLLYLPSESAKNSTTTTSGALAGPAGSAAAKRVAAMRTATTPNLVAAKAAAAGTHSKRMRRALRSSGQQTHLLSSDQQLHQFSGHGHANESGNHHHQHHHSLLGLSLSSGAAPLALPLPAANRHGAGLGHRISSAAASTFSVKRHRRARSQSLLASTLSLSSLSSLQLHSSAGASGGGGSRGNNSGTGNGKGSPAGLAHAISQHQLSSSSALQTGTYLESSGAQETAKYVPMLVAFMIDHASALFGQETLQLFESDSPDIDGRCSTQVTGSVDGDTQRTGGLDVVDSNGDSSVAVPNERPVDVEPLERDNRANDRQTICDQARFDQQQHHQRPACSREQSPESPELPEPAAHQQRVQGEGYSQTTTTTTSTTETAATDEGADSTGGSSSRASSSTSGLHSESPALSINEQDSPQQQPIVTAPITVLQQPAGGGGNSTNARATADHQQHAVYTLTCYRNSLPPLQQQQQQPYQQHQPHHMQSATIGSQRSHVMLLRDYYLSLQQHQQQQQHRQQIDLNPTRRRSALGSRYDGDNNNGSGKGHFITHHRQYNEGHNNDGNGNISNNKDVLEKKCIYQSKQQQHRSAPIDKMARQSSQSMYILRHQHQPQHLLPVKPAMASSHAHQPLQRHQSDASGFQHQHQQAANRLGTCQHLTSSSAGGDDASATTVVVVEAARRAGNELSDANNNTSAAASAAANITTAMATASSNRPQPRMAHIRLNQFNGLYVRNASNSGLAPASAIVTVPGAANMHHLHHRHPQQFSRPTSVSGGNGLLVHQHQGAPAAVRVVPNIVMTHHGHGHGHRLHQPQHRHQYSKDSNHSSTEQSLSSAASSADESDESFIGECMESTMV